MIVLILAVFSFRQYWQKEERLKISKNLEVLFNKEDYFNKIDTLLTLNNWVFGETKRQLLQNYQQEEGLKDSLPLIFFHKPEDSNLSLAKINGWEVDLPILGGDIVSSPFGSILLVIDRSNGKAIFINYNSGEFFTSQIKKIFSEEIDRNKFYYLFNGEIVVNFINQEIYYTDNKSSVISLILPLPLLPFCFDDACYSQLSSEGFSQYSSDGKYFTIEIKNTGFDDFTEYYIMRIYSVEGNLIYESSSFDEYPIIWDQSGKKIYLYNFKRKELISMTAIW